MRKVPPPRRATPWWLVILAICFWPVTLIYWLCSRRRNSGQQRGSPGRSAGRIIAAEPVTYPDTIPGHALAYDYDDVEIYAPWDYLSRLDLRAVSASPALALRPEPDNDYDPYAVALDWAGRPFGYLHRNRLQDMAHKWMQRGWPVYANFERGEKAGDDSNIYISIAFYKPNSQ